MHDLHMTFKWSYSQLDKMLQFKVDKLNPKWTSSFVVGVTNQQAESISSLKSALSLTKSTWLIKSNSVFHNGKKVLFF